MGIWGNFWSFVKPVEDPFEFQGNLGLSLEALQRKRASSSMQGRISYFAWICGGKLRVLIELCVDLGDHSCLLREVRSPLVLRGAPRDSLHIAAGMNRASNPVEVGISGFFSIFNFNRSVLQSELESQALSCVKEWNSACLSHCSWGDMPLVELYLQPAALSG